MAISEQQFRDAAGIVGCQVSSIKAVYKVETNGSGYLTDGRLKILFEGHVFWKQLEDAGYQPVKIIAQYPAAADILYPKWTKKYYIGGKGEWVRHSRAIDLCKKIGADTMLALNSASYGSFQVMGFNSVKSGYSDAQVMITAFNSGGEYEHLVAFCRYVKAVKLDDELRAKDWARFAYHYNGPGYKGSPLYDWDDYDIKLAKADAEFAMAA